MPTFPTLSVDPTIDKWEEGVVADPTLSTNTEGGYKVTRARFTRIPEKWHVGYTAAPRADKALVKTFERDTVGVGSASFTWVNPDTGVSHTVRFAGPVSYKPYGIGRNISRFNSAKSIQYWDIEFDIEEV